MVQFAAPTTGIYRIEIDKVRADEYGNFLGTALIKNIPWPYQVYLPIVLKNAS
jgi:hypothetical protein